MIFISSIIHRKYDLLAVSMGLVGHMTSSHKWKEQSDARGTESCITPELVQSVLISTSQMLRNLKYVKLQDLPLREHQAISTLAQSHVSK